MKWLLAIFMLFPLSAGAMPKKSPELISQGKSLYQINCAICHGDKGRGDGPAGIDLNPHPRNFVMDKFKNGTEPQQIFKTITEGLSNTPMPSFSYMSEDERWALAFYINALHNGDVK